MKDEKNKMSALNWFILLQFAIVFDLFGWVLMFGINEATFGIAGVLLNLLAGFIFLTFSLMWRKKGIGNAKFFVSLGLNFSLEAIPIVGTILPMWVTFVLRARKSYNQSQSSSLTGNLTSALGAPSIKGQVI